VKVVHLKGERRDFFETSSDVWELFKLIVAGRRQREIDPTAVALRECLDNPALEDEDAGTRERIAETLKFIETMSTLADEMLRLKPETLMKTLGLTAKISNAVRRRS
jgi:DNA-binding transcriptional regulator GbsR (MarR family)